MQEVGEEGDERDLGEIVIDMADRLKTARVAGAIATFSFTDEDDVTYKLTLTVTKDGRDGA